MTPSDLAILPSDLAHIIYDFIPHIYITYSHGEKKGYKTFGNDFYNVTHVEIVNGTLT